MLLTFIAAAQPSLTHLLFALCFIECDESVFPFHCPAWPPLLPQWCIHQPLRRWWAPSMWPDAGAAAEDSVIGCWLHLKTRASHLMVNHQFLCILLINVSETYTATLHGGYGAVVCWKSSTSFSFHLHLELFPPWCFLLSQPLFPYLYILLF